MPSAFSITQATSASHGLGSQETRNQQQQDTLATGRVSRSSEAASCVFEAARSDFAFNCQSGPAAPNFSGSQGQQKLDGVHNQAVSRFFPSLRTLTTFTATRRVGSRIKKNLRWGKHPIAPAGFSCFPLAMVEPRYLRSQRLATTQPLPNPSRIGIQINWGKAVAETIEIRHRHAGMAKRVCCINPAGAGPGCRQESKVQFALDAQAQMIFASRPGRRAT